MTDTIEIELDENGIATLWVGDGKSVMVTTAAVWSDIEPDLPDHRQAITIRGNPEDTIQLGVGE